MRSAGWKNLPANRRLALEITSTEERSDRMKADAKANFEKAERAFQERDFDGAAKLLDLAEEGNPSELAFANLRGEILLEQGKFDEAETAFRKVLAGDPKSREAQYNFAQVPFKKGDYAKARERFEALFAEAPGDEKNPAAQLIKYKIFMTLLLEGKDAEAERLMNQFKFTGDTPALYYAHAAWEYEHGRTEQGRDWVTSAEKIYPPALNLIFANSFYDLSWLKKAWRGRAAADLRSGPGRRFASESATARDASWAGRSDSCADCLGANRCRRRESGRDRGRGFSGRHSGLLDCARCSGHGDAGFCCSGCRDAKDCRFAADGRACSCPGSRLAADFCRND